MDSAPINHFLFELGEGTLSFRTAKHILQSNSTKSKDIAAELDITYNALRERLDRICRKLQVGNSVHEIRVAYIRFLEEEIQIYL